MRRWLLILIASNTSFLEFLVIELSSLVSIQLGLQESEWLRDRVKDPEKFLLAVSLVSSVPAFVFSHWLFQLPQSIHSFIRSGLSEKIPSTPKFCSRFASFRKLTVYAKTLKLFCLIAPTLSWVMILLEQLIA